jgi:hypothetical protein
MKKLIFVTTALFLTFIISAQEDIGYFLPNDISYNEKVRTPGEVAGHEIGEWHLTHDKLISYLMELAKTSDRAVWEEYGRSYENRPLGHLIISSPDNIKNIDQLREEHIKLCDPSMSQTIEIKSMPLFIKLGYGIHGNESSAQNASILVAYYLVAGEGQNINDLLRNTVILIDPSLNPDGMQRHSSWVNSSRSLNNNTDPASMEFNEPWPGGRTNHYWFDLNRDYLMLQHPESVGRNEAFYKWRPNIVTDHHEMGAHSTFFFQPGVQERNNPLTPVENQHLTAEIGKFHEKHLNSAGSLYYTEESFDDYYLGKGSSYPDIHGSVGILFEQAGVRGHLRETPGGLLSFPFAIKNQFIVSLSTLEAGQNMRLKLLEYQRNFYKEAVSKADKNTTKAYVFSEPSDNKRTAEFISNLLKHRIKIYKLAKDLSKNGVDYKADFSYVVPVKQNEYYFIRSLFETITNFSDSSFYDVSTWVLPMSFNIKFDALNTQKETEGLIGQEITAVPEPIGRLTASENTYAYLFEWNEYLAPKALYKLQDAGIITRVATEKFYYDDGVLQKEFSYGTILVHVTGQKMRKEDLRTFLSSVAKECGIIIYGIKTGLTPSGIDLGSNALAVLQKPSVLMFAGNGISSGDAGEIWHMFDTRFGIPLTMVSPERSDNIDFNRYNVIIIAGSPDLGAKVTEEIRTWNRKGGTIIGYKGGNRWISDYKLADIEYIPAPESGLAKGVYINRSSYNQVRQIPGSIFETTLDLTHPICYGYNMEKLPVFKTGNSVVRKNSDIYGNPVIYTSSPLLSGYCSQENTERVKDSPFVSVHRKRVISIYDNTNFRAIWYGTNKIFLNAVFFGQLL